MIWNYQNVVEDVLILTANGRTMAMNEAEATKILADALIEDIENGIIKPEDLKL